MRLIGQDASGRWPLGTRIAIATDAIDAVAFPPTA